jgi:PhnB protein
MSLTLRIQPLSDIRRDVIYPCSMKAQHVHPIPEHLKTLTPRLVVREASRAVEFYRRAFGAEELGERFLGPKGEVIHAELQIGDSVVMITEDSDPDAPAKSPQALGGVTAIMATYWPDVRAAWKRAVEAGAEVLYPLEDQFYGERGGRLRDPFGQQWILSQRLEVLTPKEMRERAAKAGF